MASSSQNPPSKQEFWACAYCDGERAETNSIHCVQGDRGWVSKKLCESCRHFKEDWRLQHLRGGFQFGGSGQP